MIKYLRSLILILLPFSACGMLLGHGIEEAQIDSPIGSGRQGYSGDGQAAVKADLDQPFDVTIDQKGRILFSDTFNHCIRRHDPKNGLIETIAGNGKKGFSGDGGPATEAMLNEPYGIKLSPDDRLLYIVDRLNFRVRRVNLETGTIQTFAGNGKPEYSGDGGPAMIAGLVEPNGVALGPGSNGPASAVYIADVRGHRIRVVETESGVIRTFAGTGKGRHDGDGGPASE
ncbi:MAG: Serine/threonine-protein kinase PknD, partial [Planctomycetota bacterium]